MIPIGALSMEIFKEASFAAFVLLVRTIESSVAAVLTSNKAVTAVSASNAVRTLAAQALGVSIAVTGTLMVFGDPVIPAAVTIILALPVVVIVPTALAVSTCWTLPAMPGFVLAELGAGMIPIVEEIDKLSVASSLS